MTERFSLKNLYGRTELHSRREPCSRGEPFCGRYMNWTEHVDGDGNRTVEPEWIGASIQCDGIPEKVTLWKKLRRALG